MEFKDIRLFLFDMDGTLYLGEQLFDFTKDMLAAIRASGREYRFLTNNSSRDVGAYVEKMARLGVASVPEDFITSAHATIHYLRQHHPGARLYLCGTQALKHQFEDAGFSVPQDVENTDVIALGLDTELTFRKLEDICKLLAAHPDMPYIATHPDLVCPTEFGSVPDCGSVIEMLEHATGKRPVVIGKPQPLIAELAMQSLGVTAAQTAVVGDRLYTDIACGINAGTTSVLVLTGETTPEMLEKSDTKPDLVLQSGAEILEALRKEAEQYGG
ncbi:MAG: HAD-IIA family hydrolase [Oscillospiraceae bacterium]|nr:HAD-IIA family hydrolase [Oscillospiraceae bacterium]